MRWALLAPLGLIVTGCGGLLATLDDSPQNDVKTFSGGSASGAADGPVATATFNNPVNVAAAPDGSIYVADFDNHRVRKISSAGIVSTVVFKPEFRRPFGLSLSPDGSTLLIQTDGSSTGTVPSPNGALWTLNTATGTSALLTPFTGRPRGLLHHPSGKIILANLTRHTLHTMNPDGSGLALLAGQDGVLGFANGTGAAAQFHRPYGMIALADGSILVADSGNHRIRRVTLAGEASTFGGTGVQGSTDGPLATATFNTPQDLALAPDGTIYVADTGGKRIRRIRGGMVTTVAGSGVAGFKDGDPLSSQFYGLEGMDVHKSGLLVVADGTNGEDQPYHRVRLVKVP